MSEHELWNELGNLYFLSGFYNQAVNAYNKAIELESGFGKPLSNLALILTKQAKYEDAIPLYKKSLDLLTNDSEKAITWDRLGNVYRQLKIYEDAVLAYQRADDLRSKITKDSEPSNQLLYVLSESEYLFYEDANEEHEIQNHFTDYMIDVEPEFNEVIPEFEPVEAENRAIEYQAKHSTYRNGDISSIPEHDSMLTINEAETSEHVLLEDNTPTNPEKSDANENPLTKSNTNDFDDPIDQAFSDNSLNEEVDQEQENSVLSMSKAGSQERSSEIQLDTETPTTLETDKRQEEDAGEKDPAYSEPNTQLDSTIGTVAGDLPKMTSEANDCINNEVPERDEVPIESVISEEENTEETLEVLGTTIFDTDPHSETTIIEENGACEEFSGQIEYESEHTAEYSAEFNKSTPSTESPSKIAEVAHITENVIGPEEKKLTKQIEINPRNATTWEALGSFYKASGRYEEAIQAFEQAVSIAPGVVSYYHNLGLVNSVAGNNESAFNAFQKVLELEPNHSLTHASLGGYYKKIGLEELAQHHIGKAMKNIYSSENEYNRACLESICGNNAQAIKLLRTALEKKQTYVDWVLHDPDLDSLRDDKDFKQLISDFSK